MAAGFCRCRRAPDHTDIREGPRLVRLRLVDAGLELYVHTPVARGLHLDLVEAHILGPAPRVREVAGA